MCTGIGEPQLNSEGYLADCLVDFLVCLGHELFHRDYCVIGDCCQINSESTDGIEHLQRIRISPHVKIRCTNVPYID